MLDRAVTRRFADEWWGRVHGDVPTPGNREPLADLVADLAEALCSEPFSVDAAIHAGAALVELRLNDPVVIAQSAAALSRLPALLAAPADRAEYEARLPVLIGALGQGFAYALQRQTADAARHVVADAVDAAGRNRSRFRALFDNTAAAIFVSDLDGRFAEVNPAMTALLGSHAGQLCGTSVLDFLHPDDRDDIIERVHRQLIGPGRGRLRLELRLRRPDGDYAWMSGSLALVPATTGNIAGCDSESYLIGFGEDVTEQRRLREELYWQARHDPLTALPNRLYLREMLDTAIATAGPNGRVGMCFLDLDGFKAVNDRYGHSVGDRLLSVIATRLRAATTDTVDLMARLGGDEFVALIAPPVVEDRVVSVSRALLAAVRRPVDIGGRTVCVSASIGALSTRIGGLDAEALLDAADAGLYRAKADTRERIALQVNPSQEFPALEPAAKGFFGRSLFDNTRRRAPEVGASTRQGQYLPITRATL